MMRTWEDIIKDKLEGYESPLPEGSLDEFHSLLDGKVNTIPAKRFPLVWVTVAVVAAGLATVLFLRQPAAPENEIQVVPRPAAPVAVAVEQTVEPAVETSGENEPARDDAPAAVHTLNRITYTFQQNTEAVDTVTQSEEIASESPPEEDKIPVNKPDSLTGHPFPLRDTHESRPATIRIVPAAGALAGGGLLAAVAMPFLKGGRLAGDSDIQHGDLTNTVSVNLGPKEKDELLGAPVHHRPLRLGLSARAPVGGGFYLTTGIDYSLYQSDFKYSLSGDIRQTAHFLGVPLRVDWAFASGKILDAYVGGGVEGEMCVRATFAGKSVKRDGASLSILGVGGLQLNLTRHLGLYLEPELSWRAIPGKSVLETYRNEHPVMFSAKAGLRIDID